KRHPVVAGVLLDDSDVGDVVRWRAGRDLVDLLRDRRGDLPRALGAPRHEPHALEAHVVKVADLEYVLVGVDGARHRGRWDRVEFRLALIAGLWRLELLAVHASRLRYLSQ